jgi:hypothetical protein
MNFDRIQHVESIKAEPKDMLSRRLSKEETIAYFASDKQGEELYPGEALSFHEISLTLCREHSKGIPDPS